MGQVTAIAAKSSSGVPISVANAITYQPFGPVSGLTYGNGIAETRSFDLDYRLTRLIAAGNSQLQDMTYTYVTAITDAVNSANSQSMGYDALNRLNSGAGFWSTQNLTWDPVGNVLSVVTNSSVTNSFAYVSGSSASPPSRRTGR